MVGGNGQNERSGIFLVKEKTTFSAINIKVVGNSILHRREPGLDPIFEEENLQLNSIFFLLRLVEGKSEPNFRDL